MAGGIATRLSRHALLDVLPSKQVANKVRLWIPIEDSELFFPCHVGNPVSLHAREVAHALTYTEDYLDQGERQASI